jgi:hypothetical protein
MDTKNFIKTGDIVSVNFNNAKYTLASKAKVLWMPENKNDSWTFKDLETGDIHNVSEGCTVTRKAKP